MSPVLLVCGSVVGTLTVVGAVGLAVSFGRRAEREDMQRRLIALLAEQFDQDDSREISDNLDI